MKNTLLLLLLFLGGIAAAQTGKLPYKTPGAPEVPKARLFLAASAGKDHILLRWAPSDAHAWKTGNQYGYMLLRFTVSRDEKLVGKPEVIASKGAIRPLSLKRWDSLARVNDYAAVLAQAVWGEDFEVEVNNDKGAGKFINKMEKQKQRYVSALYAADHDFTAATYAGLGWTDKSAKPNERYLYRLFMLAPKSKLIIDTASFYIGLADAKPLPKPAEIHGSFGDRTAMLTWDFGSFASHYGSYFIERSADGGKTFHRLSEQPYTQSGAPEVSPEQQGLAFYMDSLPSNETVFHYRIQGVDLFGKTGPYSDAFAGKGRMLLSATPNIRGVVFDDKGKASLSWEFEDSTNLPIRSFEVRSSETIDGNYTLIGNVAGGAARSLPLDSIPETAYVTVTAVPEEGEGRMSQPFLVQAEDSTAPVVPVGLVARVDSAGVVNLSWQANTEKDLLGYKVYRTFVRGNEFVTVMDTVWKGVSFTDTLNMRALNRRIFYTVRAIDKRYNQSPFAVAVEVKKPDVIPPTQAVFSGYNITEKGLSIDWVNSSDEDVKVHRLFRREAADTAQWQLVAEFPGRKTTTYTDQPENGDRSYSYTLIAEDSVGLQSAPSQPLTVFIPAKRLAGAFKKMDVEADRDARQIQVRWTPVAANIQQYELYRSEDKTPLSLYKVLDGNDTSFVDTFLTVNTRYQYALRAVYRDGKMSDLVIKKINY